MRVTVALDEPGREHVVGLGVELRRCRPAALVVLMHRVPEPTLVAWSPSGHEAVESGGNDVVPALALGLLVEHDHVLDHLHLRSSNDGEHRRGVVAFFFFPASFFRGSSGNREWSLLKVVRAAAES